jgi:SOS response regulatory protein OraA/RecX
MAENSLTKDYGPRRLKLKMMRGGYKKELIEKVMKELAESNQQPDYSKIIRLTITKRKVLENKYRSDVKKLRSVKQRLVQFLAQRGYDFDNIKKILEKVYQI